MKKKEKLNTVCPNCQTVFECKISAGKNSCWCFVLPILGLNEYGDRCLCEKCLKDLIKKQHAQSTSQ